MTADAASPYVPDEAGESPIALWKRLDVMQDVLTDSDRTRAPQQQDSSPLRLTSRW